MHKTGDGTAVYLMANIAPITISRQGIQKEIEELSREMNNRPATVNSGDHSCGIILNFAL
jgi:hypothetical protein